MDNLNIYEQLDFTEIGNDAPDKIVETFLSQLPTQTQGIVLGCIKPYDGQIESYTKRSWASALSLALALPSEDVEVNIQNELGASGDIKRKYECYIYTPIYEYYKYRVFFLEYAITSYPVKIVLEQSVAKSISNENDSYIFQCNNQKELEQLLVAIFTSKQMIKIMQDIIRVYQFKKSDAENKDIQDNTIEDVSGDV